MGRDLKLQLVTKESIDNYMDSKSMFKTIENDIEGYIEDFIQTKWLYNTDIEQHIIDNSIELEPGIRYMDYTPYILLTIYVKELEFENKDKVLKALNYITDTLIVDEGETEDCVLIDMNS